MSVPVLTVRLEPPLIPGYYPDTGRDNPRPFAQKPSNPVACPYGPRAPRTRPVDTLHFNRFITSMIQVIPFLEVCIVSKCRFAVRIWSKEMASRKHLETKLYISKYWNIVIILGFIFNMLIMATDVRMGAVSTSCRCRGDIVWRAILKKAFPAKIINGTLFT